ncbi:MAG TPA: alpha/beta hydrolase [Gaiellaceae bacterium]|nr:alpha/beta hydrolase [Gaiellaceae bacterium]
MGDDAPTVGHVISRDGTRIGFRRSGEGPPLVLLHGATGAHWSFRYILPSLADRFTLYAVDRRGRGESGDAAAYAIEREVEDVTAVVESLDEPANVFGHSYGATVALGAALVTPGIRKLVLYEGSPGISVVPDEHLDRMEELVERGEPGEALVYALGLFGLTPEEVEQLREAPTWPVRVSAAHTVAREVRAEQDYRLDPQGLAGVTAPALLLLGGESPDWAREGTEQISDALPDARIAVLPGEGHAAIMTAPELVAGEVRRFLAE